MKKITLILAGIIISLTTFAQGKYGATPEDSLVCIESLIYKDYLKSDPDLAKQLWRKAYAICPQSQKSLYINGVKIYKSLAKEVLATTAVATFIVSWNCLFGNYQDLSGASHAGPLNSLLPVLALPLTPFTLSSPSLGLLLGKNLSTISLFEVKSSDTAKTA